MTQVCERGVPLGNAAVQLPSTCSQQQSEKQELNSAGIFPPPRFLSSLLDKEAAAPSFSSGIYIFSSTCFQPHGGKAGVRGHRRTEAKCVLSVSHLATERQTSR